MMRTRSVNPEVLYPDEAVVRISRGDIGVLASAAKAGARRRARLCAHLDPADPLHEMLIVLGRHTYIRPHKHVNKSESFHVVEGEGLVVLFDDGGEIEQAISLGDYASGRCFFYRLAQPRFHSIIVMADNLIVHETTNGPLRPSDTIYAPWAPAEDDSAACAEYRGELMARAASWQAMQATGMAEG